MHRVQKKSLMTHHWNGREYVPIPGTAQARRDDAAEKAREEAGRVSPAVFGTVRNAHAEFFGKHCNMKGMEKRALAAVGKLVFSYIANGRLDCASVLSAFPHHARKEHVDGAYRNTALELTRISFKNGHDFRFYVLTGRMEKGEGKFHKEHDFSSDPWIFGFSSKEESQSVMTAINSIISQEGLTRGASIAKAVAAARGGISNTN